MIILLKRKYLYMIAVLYKSRGIIIKQTSVKVLDERDMEFIEALRSLDVPRDHSARRICIMDTVECDLLFAVAKPIYQILGCPRSLPL